MKIWYKSPGFLAMIMFLVCSTRLAHASVLVFERDYTYQASEIDSKVTSRIIALEQVKRILLEEIGMYMETKTEIKEMELTLDQISTLTAGIVGVKIIEEKWDGISYFLKAKISADPDEVVKSVDALHKDTLKTKELEKIKKRSDEYLTEIHQLRKELEVAKIANPKNIPEPKFIRKYSTEVDRLSAINLFDEAYRLQMDGKNQEAIDKYSISMQKDPLLADAYINRGIIYSALKNSEQALIDYNKAIEIDPLIATAYYSRGNLYSHMGGQQKAIEDFTKAIVIDPTFIEAYINRGNAYSILKNSIQAINDYSKAIELNPKNASAYFNRGNKYMALGNIQRAIEDFNKTISIDPSHAKAYFNLGNAYSDLGNNKQAIENYDKSVEINPTVAEVYCNRGLAYFALNNNLLAVEDFNRAIDINPEDALAYANRGVAYSALGNTSRAIKDLLKAAKLGNKGAQEMLDNNNIRWH